MHTKNNNNTIFPAMPKLLASGRSKQTAPIFLAWTFLTGLVCIFQLACDAFQEYAPRFPVVPLLFTCVGFSSACVAIVWMVGRRTYPSCFVFYQPFVGGDTFTVMQILGHTAFGCGVSIDLIFWRMYVSGAMTGPFHGILSVAGVLLAFANVILMSSIDHYTVQTQSNLSHQQQQGNVPRLNLKNVVASKSSFVFLHNAVNRTTIVVLTMTLLGNTLPPLAAGWYPLLTDVAFAVQLALHIAAASLVHVYIGWMHTPNYRLFMPFPQGSIKVGFTQAFAWFTFTLALQGSMFLIRVGSAAPLAIITGVCVTSFMSVISLLLFVRIWPFHLSEQQQLTNTSSTHSKRRRLESWFIVRHGRFTASTVLICDAFFLIVTSTALLLPTEVSTMVGVTFTEQLQEGLYVCQVVSAAFLLTLTPLTHSIGVLEFPGTFDLWAPFTGSKGYIALQALGWFFYTSALICGVAAFTVGPHMTIGFACMAVLGQLLIHASLHVFDPALSHTTQNSPRSSPMKATSHPVIATTTTTTTSSSAVNGELLLSVLLTAGGVAMRVMVDFSDSVVPQSVLLGFATATFVVATPMAHLSTRSKHAPIFSPFQGPAEYVALQAVGWTLYALFIVLSGMSVAEGHPFGTLSWSSEAVVQGIPFTMIVLSAFAWREDDSEQSPGGNSSLSSPTKGKLALQQSLVDGKDPRVLAERLCAILSHEDHQPQHNTALLRALKGYLDSHHPTSSFDVSLHSDTTKEDAIDTASPTATMVTSVRHRMRDIAGLTTAALCMGELVLCLLAAYFSTVPARSASAAVLAIAGALCSSMTCFGLHSIYGPLAQGKAYRVFMPFSGGTTFVVLQGCAWGSYSASVLIVLAFLTSDTCNCGGYALPLAFAGILGSAAQLLILQSIAAFATYSPKDASFLEVHAEGSVAFLLFLATFAFQHVVQHANALGGDTLSPIALLVSSTSIMLALPLALIALRKTRSRLESLSAQSGLDEDSPLDATPKKRRNHTSSSSSSSSSQPLPHNHDQDSASTTEYLIIPFTALFPVAMLYVAYFMMYRYTDYAAVAVNSLLYGFYALICVTVVVILSRSFTAVPQPIIDLRIVATSCALYLIPTLIVLPSYVVPLVWPCRATYMWAVTITLFTIIPPPFNRKVLRPIIGAYIGFWWYEAVSGQNPWLVLLSLSESYVSGGRALIGLFVDWATPVFWFVYSFTYSNFPEEHGHRRSKWFLEWFKKHVFDDAAKYFQLRVIADAEMKGKLNNPTNKYVFGFHPHGVFPATAMYGSETDEWKRELGSSSDAHVTCHGANIIFNGPLLRDFVMAIGGRSVTRRGIEQSLDEGNSVVVVVGGQGELILTSRSTTELHLVTHHHGIMRLAVRKQVPLVPMLVFGENNILDNLHWYQIQRRFLKVLGFPFPLLPIGRWGLPVPHQTQLTIVVGRPIAPPPNLHHDDNAGIELLTKQYFDEVRRLFESKKEECGFPNMQLRLHYGLPAMDPRARKQGHPVDGEARLSAAAPVPEIAAAAGGSKRQHTSRSTKQ